MDRNTSAVSEVNSHDRRSLRGNVDRNVLSRSYTSPLIGRSLRGNVDRNSYRRCVAKASRNVVPYVGTWIEMYAYRADQNTNTRRSLRGNVDRNQDGDMFRMRRGKCRSLRGNVDRNVGAVIAILTMVLSFPTWERG